MSFILDLTRLSAAYGTRLLAEAGHRVVRVESPAGDDVRRASPFLRATCDLEHGAYHQFLNAGKESVTLDLETADGGDAFRRLVQAADCVIATTPACRDAAWFLETNPKLALVEVDDIDNELCAYAASGLLSLTGHPDKAPVVLGGHASLSIIGLYTAIAGSAALMCATSGGTGQHVEVSAQQCLESLVEQALLTYHTTEEVPERRGLLGMITAVSGAFPCADGYWMVSVPNDLKNWNQLMEWVNDPELRADPTLAEGNRRQQRRDFILGRIAEWSKSHKKEEIVVGAQMRRVPASPVATVLDLAHDPQLTARGFLQKMEHPLLGQIEFPMGATASASGVKLKPAPTLGQHTAHVLREIGYSWADAHLSKTVTRDAR
jgi:crotonobetainyl-CoA:carnitine CoA-transferase CaiB-like acyl-CoA transferase